jgi:hypothetical protein
MILIFPVASENGVAFIGLFEIAMQLGKHGVCLWFKLVCF